MGRLSVVIGGEVGEGVGGGSTVSGVRVGVREDGLMIRRRLRSLASVF